MTAFDRFDPLERRITEAIDEIASARPPAYLTDILRQTARSSQRPRWTFPERWLSVDTSLSRPTVFGRIPMRQLLLLALLVALAAAALTFYVGQHGRVAPPFGPAGNGAVVYSSNGDLYVRDTLTSPGRILIGGPDPENFAGYTPDGSHLTYAVTRGGVDHLMVANADGTNPVEIAVLASAADTFGNVSPDGRTFALVFPINGVPTLSMVAMDGTSTRTIDLGGRRPLEVSWSPPNGDLLLIRAQDPTGDGVDLYTLKPDGTGLHAFNLPGFSDFGSQYTLSGAAWTPDGTQIVYNGADSMRDASGTVSQAFRLHVVSFDGSNDRALPGPKDPSVQENWAAVSPDGKWIAAQDWTFNQTGGGAVILPLDGSAPGRDVGPQFVGGDISKAWSPDGSKLLIGVNSGSAAYLVDPATGSWEKLTWTNGLPDWQRIARP